jgi:hypothetical protein
MTSSNKALQRIGKIRRGSLSFPFMSYGIILACPESFF